MGGQDASGRAKDAQIHRRHRVECLCGIRWACSQTACSRIPPLRFLCQVYHWLVHRRKLCSQPGLTHFKGEVHPCNAILEFPTDRRMRSLYVSSLAVERADEKSTQEGFAKPFPRGSNVHSGITDARARLQRSSNATFIRSSYLNLGRSSLDTVEPKF